MMNEFKFGFELQLAALAIDLLLIIILIVIIIRQITSKKDHKISEVAKQAEEIKLAAEPLFDTEFKNEPFVGSQPDAPLSSSELFVETQTNETALAPSLENLPQDSMLRRHYLTHLRAMIESLKTPHPTDASLGRHYDSIITAEMEQCLSEQGAIERLIGNYENYKKTLAQPIQDPKTIAEPSLKAGIRCEESAVQHENSKLPEDSMLRRHTMTHLYAIVESNMPLRPTDSVLRRHYDTMINNEVNKLLDCNVV